MATNVYDLLNLQNSKQIHSVYNFELPLNIKRRQHLSIFEEKNRLKRYFDSLGILSFLKNASHDFTVE